MPGNWYILSGILVTAAVTWALRTIPFAMLAPLRESALLNHLGKRMPVGIMCILTVYSLSHINAADAAEVLPAAVALTATVGLHLWRRNPTLSIFAGTGIYVLLASTLPTLI